MASIAEIVSALRAGEMTQQQGVEAIEAEIDAAVSVACDRDGMAMSVMQGLLAGQVDSNHEALVDRSFALADLMVLRRAR